jgi:phosphoribosylamine--glycine ligase
MKVLVIGSGGREHALVWKLAASPQVKEMTCAPGNPGIASLARCVPIPAEAIDGLLAFARGESIDLTVVGPEQPLALGIVDAFRAAGLPVFGPTRNAAELEWSKAFAKNFMRRHDIPTADFRTFGAGETLEALDYAERCSLPVVVKADGLAAGKGVLICATREEVREALAQVMERGTFGNAGGTDVIEEFMEGEEASVFAVTDGEAYVTLAAAQDHKRINDGDRGKNTGGMGAYAPAPCVSNAVLERVRREIIVPTLKGMREEGRPYTGCLYVGLMLTASGPRVVEYNCRFGDPETQVVLPLYGGDLAALFLAAARGELAAAPAEESRGSAVCVVLVSGGYPDAYPTGAAIHGLDEASVRTDAIVFHAGTRRGPDGALLTAGGRVLGVTAIREDARIDLTIAAAYEAVRGISFDGMHYRRDIGKRALAH